MKISNAGKFICVTAVNVALLTSCISTPPTDNSTNTETQTQQATTETKQEQSKPTLIEETKPATVKTSSALDEYKRKIDGISVKALATPKDAIRGKNFASDFVVSVSKSDGSPVSGLEFTVLYPINKSVAKDGTTEIKFEEKTIASSEDGKVTFTSPTPTKTFDSTVRFFPKGDMTNAKIAEAAKTVTAEIPYKVRTDLRNSGGIIAYIDFDKNGNASANSISSSNLLTALMKLGFTGVGNSNSTINNAVIKGTQDDVYKSTKNLVGSKSAFVAYGTVKYADNGNSLAGEISVLSLADGSLLHKASKTVSLVGSDITKARKALAEYFASEIYYGI